LFVVHAERSTNGSMNINLFKGLLVTSIFEFWSCEISNIYLIPPEYPNLYSRPIYFFIFLNPQTLKL
jgi:hypothetical protein